MLQLIKHNRDQFSDQFYLTLFRKHPQMAMHFSSIDRATRQGALWGALDAITSPPETLSDVDEQLGTRHAASGVQAEEYGDFISVLIDSMADFLGNNFTPEAETTCTELLRELSDQMARADARN
jgi:hemoglobin-like flavoprotein